jgi:hypothetical protein
MIVRAFVFLVLACGLRLLAHAQNRDAQIDQSRLLQTPVVSASAKPRTASDQSALSDLLIEPDDALGAQRFLKSQQNVRPFAAAVELFGFKTNNVGLTRHDTQSDEFLVASTALSYRTALGERAALDVTLRGSIFRYNEFRTLDFNSIDAGLGLTWVPAKLGGVALFGRYNFTELFSERDGDAFFENHTVTIGAQKNFVLSRAHYFFVGLSAQAGFADPDAAQRDEYALYGGYHVDLTHNLEADIAYRYGFFVYREEGSRRDRNQNVTIALKYNVTDWFSVMATSFFGWNRSTESIFDYDVVNGGVGLGVTARF